MKNIVKLMIGTNKENGLGMIRRKFNDLLWFSDNLETVAHYWDGCVIELCIDLDSKDEMEYVRCSEELEDIGTNKDLYTYGFAEVKYPKGATWYSFSGEYLKNKICNIKEIFPDMSEFYEE